MTIGHITNIKVFLSEAVIKYKSKYDYSSVVFDGIHSPVLINCPIHGEFSQTPKRHLQSKYGCTMCGLEKSSINKNKNAAKTFFEKAKGFHEGKFDYSNSVYIDSKTKIKFLCPTHGEVIQSPSVHLKSNGCYQCGREVINKGKLEKAKKRFLKSAAKVHGYTYDYSKVDYNGSQEYVIIVCEKHGDFKQTPGAHLHGGAGCRKCYLERPSPTQITFDDFLTTCNEFFDTEKIECIGEWKGVQATKRIRYVCETHGRGTCTPRTFLKNKGCRACKGKISSYEEAVKHFLVKQKINFEREFMFSECRHINPLRFDFYLPDNGFVIEVHGEQHYKPVAMFGGKERYKDRMIRDNIKRQYVLSRSDLQMIEVSFEDVKNGSFRSIINKSIKGNSAGTKQLRLSI